MIHVIYLVWYVWCASKRAKQIFAHINTHTCERARVYSQRHEKCTMSICGWRSCTFQTNFEKIIQFSHRFHINQFGMLHFQPDSILEALKRIEENPLRINRYSAYDFDASESNSTVIARPLLLSFAQGVSVFFLRLFVCGVLWMYLCM